MIIIFIIVILNALIYVHFLFFMFVNFRYHLFLLIVTYLDSLSSVFIAITFVYCYIFIHLVIEFVITFLIIFIKINLIYF
jgi:hypothetical protein